MTQTGQEHALPGKELLATGAMIGVSAEERIKGRIAALVEQFVATVLKLGALHGALRRGGAGYGLSLGGNHAPLAQGVDQFLTGAVDPGLHRTQRHLHGRGNLGIT